jgi:VWFA-related protein
VWRITLIVLAAAGATGLGAQVAFRSKVDTALIDVLVTDRNVPVTGLTAQDFAIRDNGVTQDITHVITDASALSIVLLLDTSNSLSTSDLGHLQQSALTLARSLGMADELRLVTFSENVRFHGLIDAAALGPVFRGLQPKGDTVLRDSVVAGFQLTSRSDTRRPVLIVFSDGADTASWLQNEDVEMAAKRSWASLFAVTPRVGADPLIRTLSDLTGGEVLILDRDLASLPALFAQILDRLKRRYVLSFTPSSSAAGWHALEVRVRRSNVRVSARKGYLR